MIDLSTAYLTRSAIGPGDYAESNNKLSKGMRGCPEGFFAKARADLPVDQLVTCQLSKINERDQEEQDSEQEKKQQCELPDTSLFLKKMLEGLCDSIRNEAIENMIEKNGEFYDYLGNAADERLLDQMVALNGWTVIESSEDAYIVRDENGNQHIIERGTQSSDDDKSDFYRQLSQSVSSNRYINGQFSL